MKQSKHHSRTSRSAKKDSRAAAFESGAEGTPTGFSKARAGFREIGGQVSGYYRYLPGNRAEVMAHFQHREQIAKLCQRLQLRLEAEFDLASLKNDERRRRARRVGPDATQMAGTRANPDAAQLDLLEATLVAFSGQPEHAKSAPLTNPAGNTASVEARDVGGEVPSIATAGAQAGAQPRRDEIETNSGPAATAGESKSEAAREIKAKAKTHENHRAERSPRTLEESLSGIRPLGPASLNDGQDRVNQPKRGGQKKRNASA